jgi:hypothetical protein
MARPALARATMWCGGMVGPPRLFQVPLCPILDVKILLKISGIFQETLFSSDFHKLIND